MADPTGHPSAGGGTRQEAPHLSIGEVLGILLEEFPDVTISKIRFLESQGLIEPERTPSGYRRFYDDDVQLLRLILREQRENFLPLRVIKDRIDSGEINADGSDAPSAESTVASRQSRTATDGADLLPGLDEQGDDAAVDDDDGTTQQRPAVAQASDPDPPVEPAADATRSDDVVDDDAGDGPAEDDESVEGLVSAEELARLADTTPAHVDELRSYGLIATTTSLGEPMYDEDAVAVTLLCARLIDLGIDARHLRGWRTAVDREVGLYEGLTLPLLRQRNPNGRKLARQRLNELNKLGTKLRAALLAAALREHLHR